MTIDALRDIEFLETTQGRKSVRQFLLNAHETNTHLDLTQPGYTVSAQMRLLTAVLAVALRHDDRPIDDIRRTGLNENALNEGLKDLSAGTNPFDSGFPFMQRPALQPKGPKDNSRKLGPGLHPVKKLSPAMPPDEAEAYWNLLAAEEPALELPDALLALVVFHHMSMAGNNAYDGDKCVMGSPAMRYVGADYTATEIMLQAETALDSLLLHIPNSWVEGTGLPAWADRKCEHSVTDENKAHPLWSATWSSNAPACYWEEQTLTGVRTGGVPESWHFPPEMGTTKKSIKDWWDLRNTKDPFYLYLLDDKGDPKVQRLDLGRDGTDLAVEWATQNKGEVVQNNLAERVIGPNLPESELVFARHQIAGTASSPNIRASEIFKPNPEEWAFGLDEDVLELIQDEAERIQYLHWAVTKPFRRKNSNEGTTAVVIDELADRRPDASAQFWRCISSTYKEIISDIRSSTDGQEEAAYMLPDNLKAKTQRACMEAFDNVVNPHSLQEPTRIAFVRSQVERHVRAIINKQYN